MMIAAPIRTAPPVRHHGRRLHDDDRKGIIAMTLETIKKSDLTPSERDILAADRERWARMGAGSHLEDWLAYGPGLMIRRRLAMKAAASNAPEGRLYVEAFSKLMADDGIDTGDKSTMHRFTAVLWLHDDPERITVLRAILDGMTPGERSRLNSPITARQRVYAKLQALKPPPKPVAPAKADFDPEDDEDDEQLERERLARAFDWQTGEAERLARECALLRPGADPVTAADLRRVQSVLADWNELKSELLRRVAPAKHAPGADRRASPTAAPEQVRELAGENKALRERVPDGNVQRGVVTRLEFHRLRADYRELEVAYLKGCLVAMHFGVRPTAKAEAEFINQLEQRMADNSLLAEDWAAMITAFDKVEWTDDEFDEWVERGVAEYEEDDNGSEQGGAAGEGTPPPD
jgi:hypothetical protein